MDMSPDNAEPAHLTLTRGSLHLPREVCERFFPRSPSVALLAREGRVLLVPLAPDSAGGLLLKLRNARGDRVVLAQEFLRQNGIEEGFAPCELTALWRPDVAALELLELVLQE